MKEAVIILDMHTLLASKQRLLCKPPGVMINVNLCLYLYISISHDMFLEVCK